jgi:phosphatidylglycerophosphatase A
MRRSEVLVKATSSAAGLGHLPIAPGSWASGGACILYVALHWLAPFAWPVWIAALVALSIVVGVPLVPRAEKAYGKEDPRPFVLDEVAGMWLTCLLFWWRGPIATAAVAFFTFRVFDVFKPPPLRRLEELPDGWGVMVDDLGAAIYSALLLWPVCYYGVDPLLAVGGG